MNTALQTNAKTSAQPSFTPLQAGLLLRKCACGGSPGSTGECKGCHEPGHSLQRSTRGSGLGTSNLPSAPPLVHEVLRSPGEPLTPTTREFFESRFGHDFGQVRVHTGRAAAESAQAVNALAYTVGRDIVFGAQPYRPDTAPGQKLLAHELAHTIQQSEGAVGAGATPDRLEVSHPDDALERAADIAVAKAMADETSSPEKLTAGGSTGMRLGGSVMLQRAMDDISSEEGANVDDGPSAAPGTEPIDPVEGGGSETDPSELDASKCAEGARRLDYDCLQNFDTINFTAAKGCGHIKVELTAQWQGVGCEFGPSTYPINLDGQQKKMPAGNKGIEEECTGTKPMSGKETFAVKPGSHKLTISTGGKGSSTLCLQITGFMKNLP
jgi:hypothetical protein